MCQIYEEVTNTSFVVHVWEATMILSPADIFILNVYIVYDWTLDFPLSRKHGWVDVKNKKGSYYTHILYCHCHALVKVFLWEMFSLVSYININKKFNLILIRVDFGGGSLSSSEKRWFCICKCSDANVIKSVKQMF
jgi:hypothetical protein